MKLKINVMKSLTTMFFSALTITGVSAINFNALKVMPNQTAQSVTFPAEIPMFIPKGTPRPPQEMRHVISSEALQALRNSCQPKGGPPAPAPAPASAPKVLQGIPQEMMIQARMINSKELDESCHKKYFDKCETEYNTKYKEKRVINETLASNINNARNNGNLRGVLAHLYANYDTSRINIPAGKNEPTDYMFIESALYNNPAAFNDPVLRPIVQNVEITRDADKYARQERIAHYDFLHHMNENTLFAKKIRMSKLCKLEGVFNYVESKYNEPKKVEVSVREARRAASARFAYFWEIFKACPEALDDPKIQEAFRYPVFSEDLLLKKVK